MPCLHAVNGEDEVAGLHLIFYSSYSMTGSQLEYSMQKSPKINRIFDQAKEALGKIDQGKAASLKEEIHRVSDEFSNSSSERISDTISQANKTLDLKRRAMGAAEALDENTPDVVKDSYNRVTDTVDVITGSKILKLVQEMIGNQEEYNDVLATKLDEALTRISILEATIQGIHKDENR